MNRSADKQDASLLAASSSDTGLNPRAPTVPWSIGDVLAGVVFFALSGVVALASAQAVDSLKAGNSGTDIATASISVVLGLVLIWVTARLAHLRVRPALAVAAGAAGVVALLSAAGDASLSDTDGTLAGLPVAVYFIALIEILLLLTTLLFTRSKYRVSFETLGLVRTHRLGDYGIGLLFWSGALVAIVVYALLIQAVGADEFLFPDTAGEAFTLAGGSVPLAIFLVAILGPIGEELFFRGFLLNALRNRFGVKAAVLGSSMLFGLVHVAPGAIIPTFFLGLAFALIYVRTRSLWPAIFVHCIQNTIAITGAAAGLAT